MTKFGAIIAIASVLLIGGIVWIVSRSQATGPEQGEAIPTLGGQHIAPGEQHIPYNSNPPTSGPHSVNPQSSGIYDKELIDEQVVHSLEHGGVWIAYKPDLPKDQIDALNKIVRKNRAKVILSPRSKNDSPIALASWTRLAKLDKPDEKTILKFIIANRDHAPENVPL